MSRDATGEACMMHATALHVPGPLEKDFFYLKNIGKHCSLAACRLIRLVVIAVRGSESGVPRSTSDLVMSPKPPASGREHAVMHMPASSTDRTGMLPATSAFVRGSVAG
ncbi:hypothetical protein PVAP13_7NG155300 [Panicum virgatum]|uniref:Uncharacterized protein n=1 Tax=Panicum virgatum TaxID=38727 RepID=A0A8T0PXY0_PANVG|nr:hypothetical protein PVAP13_7NG155300 [Panicum virgatum]